MGKAAFFRFGLVLAVTFGCFLSAHAATLDIGVAASTDDAEEIADGRVNTTSSDLNLVRDKRQDQTVGIRFNGINIPQGATVLSASIQFTTDETGSQATTLFIAGEANDSAGTFNKARFSISRRPHTGAGVVWTPAAWPVVGEAGPAQRTPDISAIIQEIINRPGWTAGNALAVIISGNGQRVAKSYDGAPATAPRLHIEYVADAVNEPPVVDAGPDAALVRPDDTLSVSAEVSDDGLPNSLLNTVWTHNGGTGTGAVAFGDPGAFATSVTFVPPEPGTYHLRISADDGELQAFDELVVTISDNAGGSRVESIRLVAHTATGFDTSTDMPLTVPAIDPAGLVYHPPTQRLFIADSEINEVPAAFSVVQANLFETSTAVDLLYDQWDLTLRTGNEPALNREPTGIAYCATDDHFYVSNDDTDTVYRYAYDGRLFTAVDAVSTRPYSTDPEDVACDPDSGRLYVIGGVDTNILVYSYDGGFVFQGVLDLERTAGSPTGVATDPEGITFDPVSGNLFVLSDPDNAIFEYTTAGVFVNRFSLDGFSPRPLVPQGITIGPSSLDPTRMSFYISDAGYDNDYDPNERDGMIFEVEIQRAP